MADGEMKNWCKKAQKIPLVGKCFKAGPCIPVIRISGVIMDSSNRKNGISHARLQKTIDKAFDKAKMAVALVINSPGGAPAQASLIGAHIRRRAEEKNIPVYAFVEDVAASGGYWLACAADKIYVQDSSIIGSIGVIASGFGLEEFIDRHGIKRRLYTAGKEKSFLDPFSEVKEEDLARLKKIQKSIHDNFKGWVKERRGERLKGKDSSLFEGQIWTGGDALENGIADGLGDAFSVLAQEFGPDINLSELSPEKKLPFPLQMLGARMQTQGPWAEELLSAVENRGEWSRYGL